MLREAALEMSPVTPPGLRTHTVSHSVRRTPEKQYSRLLVKSVGISLFTVMGIHEPMEMEDIHYIYLFAHNYITFHALIHRHNARNFPFRRRMGETLPISDKIGSICSPFHTKQEGSRQVHLSKDRKMSPRSETIRLPV